MTWNYRIVKQTMDEGRHELDRETQFAIHEVYYNNAGKIVAWSQEPVRIIGNSPQQLREILDTQVSQAFTAEIVDGDREMKR